MTFDDELTLLTETYKNNEIGDHVVMDEPFDVLCAVQSVTRSEHYNGAAHGLKPEIVFVLNRYEYEKQKKVVYDGVMYGVIRSYCPEQSTSMEDFETIELVCQGLIN